MTVPNQLPTGTVTFLFTDVKGSTRLLHSLGAEAYAAALAEHRRLIREACVAESGVEVDTQGDAFFFAFPTAPGALTAASALTDALASGPIRVRVGLHTGTPLVTEEGYVGGDVNRAARIAAAGHGGQVLVAASTASLVDAELLDLGAHHFKDLGEAERVYQLGDGSFPPLRSLYRSNLPVPANPLVGRKKELLEVVRLLVRHDARVVTITGPGGVGKTRFSLAVSGEAADAFPDGVWFVALASLRDAALVLPTIADVVGAEGDLAQHLGDAESLLVLDSFEQVVDAAAEVARLLGECPRVRVLVTSRESLRVAPEHQYPLAPLPESPSVELFRQRAAAVAPAVEVEYTTAAAICERLDRLPLAVELGAARIKALSPVQVLERLDQRLDLLKGGRDADPRHQTLRATIEWSYELLSPREQQLFTRLSVFVGGCVLEAAEEVAGADLDTLQSLVEKSLLASTDERYRMLETIREYAAERLDESGDGDETYERLAVPLLALAAAEGAPMFFNRQEEAFLRLEPEHLNTRAVVEWARRRGRNDIVAQLFASLEEVWLAQGHQLEAAGWIDAAVAGCEGIPVSLAASALSSAAEVAQTTGDVERAVALYDETVALAASSDEVDPFWEAASLIELSRIALDQGDVERARVLAERSLDLRRVRTLPRARALAVLGEIALRDGELTTARHLLEEALDSEESRHALNDAFYRETLAEVARRSGDEAKAETLFREALQAAVNLHSRALVADCFEGLALIAKARGEARRAALLWATGRAVRSVVAAVPSRPREIGELAELGQIRVPEALDEAVTNALTSID
jgi:predicted ATPase/class 3 adenylate cyclase